MNILDGCAIVSTFMDSVVSHQSLVEQAIASGGSPALWVNTRWRPLDKSLPKNWPDKAVSIRELDLHPTQTGTGQAIGRVLTGMIASTILGESPCPPDQPARAPAACPRIGNATAYGQSVCFQGPNGIVLRGAWLNAPSGNTAIVFLHGKAGYRIGPNRIFCEVAEALAREGIASLRFDYRGRGDSDGEGLSLERDANERDIERCVEDVVAAIEYVRKDKGKKQILLCGICIGAYVALRAMPVAADKVEALCLLSPYIMGMEHEAAAKQRRVTRLIYHYSRRLLDAGSWRRVLRGQISFRAIGGNLLRLLRCAGIEHAVGLPSMHRCPVPCLQLCGCQDSLNEVAMPMIQTLYGRWLDIESVILEHADHNFSLPEDRQTVASEICRFARQHLKGKSNAAPS